MKGPPLSSASCADRPETYSPDERSRAPFGKKPDPSRNSPVVASGPVSTWFKTRDTSL